uniref:NADH-ubiquinone oxidoreductase chain 5 n=1 Tax=Trinorchestia longiramus TaxID=1923959 RepID=A0A385UKS8_9CRUS|nr:NADH dehydrogenase subunit 5 [Trinorchestia longiramus]AYB71595.1 NADH dehydrogenase subunit 5 [Trinorchestia longiramus]
MLKINSGIYNMFWISFFFFSILCYSVSMMLMLFNVSYFLEWEIVMFNSSVLVMSLIFDWMSVLFLGSVLIIASGISKFSDYYMSGDHNYVRFMILLVFFVLSMIFLTVSPNMASILLGWDGLGLTSYVLVVYYQNESSCNAGMLTILSNRVGDVCILLVISLMMFSGSWNFLYMHYSLGLVMSGFVVMACMTKSAQIPYSAWLPAAMAAPTPVSALVHSSTLVTAGVYLLVRFYNLLEGSMWLSFLVFISIMTMFMSGIGANFEMDMKKIIALSTLSQLGLMMMILSMGMPELAFFHLISHAMFKSSLFMCGGAIIHMSNGSQDSRFMSSLSSSSPLLMLVFSVTNLALFGFPFLSGFYSKDILLEYSFSTTYNFVLILMIIMATGMTVSYSLRVMYLGMMNISNLKSLSDLEDNDDKLIYGMVFLLFMSIFTGYIFSWCFCWSMKSVILSDIFKYSIMMVIIVSGIYMSMLVSGWKTKMKSNFYLMSFFYSKMWGLVFLSSLSNSSIMKSAYMFSSLLDKGWLESYGGKGGKSFFLNLSWVLQNSQFSVMLKSYFLTGVLVILSLLILY